MNPTEKARAEAVTAAQKLVDGAKAAGRELTADEAHEVNEHLNAIKAADDKLAAKARHDDLVSQLAASAPASAEAEDRAGAKAAPSTMGEAFVTSASYKAFRGEYPHGPGQGSPVKIDRVTVGTMTDYFDGRAKAAAGASDTNPLSTETARIQPVRMPTLYELTGPSTLLDLISRGQTAGNFEYMQVTQAHRGADVVAEAAEKPLSDFETNLQDAKVYTYADGLIVTNQMLADAPALASYLNTQLRANLDWVMEDKLLNGTGVSGEPKGILHTTGIGEQSYTGASALDLVKAVRQAMGKVRRLPGGRVTAVLLSPEDDDAIDLMQDGNGQFYGQGPFGTGPATLWGAPRVVSDRLQPGQALVGDFSQIALLDREGLSVVAFNQHLDFARRNLTYVRAELRAAQVIWRPDRIVNVTKG